MKNKVKNCPNDHGVMRVKKMNKKMKFRGENISFQVEHYVCSTCGTEGGSIDQTAATQRTISGAYRRKVGLLTSEDILEGRGKLGLTQSELTKRMSVGIASIKRWEGGLIQSRSMDKALRMALQGKRVGDTYTGNRTFSIPRIKLVLKEFESTLRKRLLVKNDKMLYAAKYLWYADMVAFRELGRSMTGATYARLPMGPQLNNYRDLVGEIKEADDTATEPLTLEERMIINRISMAFPQKQMIYQAAHDEIIWKKRANGAIIPYSDAKKLRGL